MKTVFILIALLNNPGEDSKISLLAFKTKERCERMSDIFKQSLSLKFKSIETSCVDRTVDIENK